MRALAFLAFLILIPQTTPRTAREYYDELYAAGGLDRLTARYACFDDDTAFQTFFIYNESSHVRDYWIAHGTFSKLPKDVQDKLNKKNWIIGLDYDKGVPEVNWDYYGKDGPSWVSKVNNECCMRVRLMVNPATMRYKRSLEILNSNGTMKNEVARYGKCELVKPDIKQSGQPGF